MGILVARGKHMIQPVLAVRSQLLVWSANVLGIGARQSSRADTFSHFALFEGRAHRTNTHSPSIISAFRADICPHFKGQALRTIIRFKCHGLGSGTGLKPVFIVLQ